MTDTADGTRTARNGFAEGGDVPERDAASLDSPTGREDRRGLTEARALAASEINKPIGAKPAGATTAIHDAGSGANTVNGLARVEEALRRSVEDAPSGGAETEDIPVFDRRDLPPRV